MVRDREGWQRLRDHFSALIPNRQGIRRVVFIGLLVIFLAPSLIGVATHDSVGSGATGTPTGNRITFISTQGTATQTGAGVYAINTSTKTAVWSYTKCPEKCFDVDPLSNDTVLFVGKTKSGKPWNITNSSTYNWKATVMNWRTGKVIDQFSVPIETHDVDYLGNGQYVIANKVHHDGAERKWIKEAKRQGWIRQNRSTHSHLLYIYDRDSDEIIWEYRFVDHYPRSAGDGYDNDYTHLNDVDVVQNGSAFLVSPREFDRVMLINRSTKETEWTLGEEDNYSILHEQHNPTLLSTSPPTVLVSDSENNRVVEYRMVDGDWERVWTYAKDLDWPRDADRLPNGNTLIVDTGNDRVLEVSPNKTIVWQFDIQRGPYDIERIRYGDEPQGPPMSELNNQNSSHTSGENDDLTTIFRTVFDEYYGLALWVLPPGVGILEFVSLHGVLLIVIIWVGDEWRNHHS